MNAPAADQSGGFARAGARPEGSTQLCDCGRLLAWLDERATTGALLPAVIYGAAATRIRRGDFDIDRVRMLLEFELIDDAFCDVYEDQPISTQGHVALGRAIGRLHDWRTQYGLTYEPFRGAE